MELRSISDYLRAHGHALAQRVLDRFPPLHSPQDPLPERIRQLKRRPFPAQTLALMGIVERLRRARCAAAVAECGTGKTLISLGSIFVHAAGRPFTALAMTPPQLTEKWARECFQTIPGVRVFMIDGVRNGAGSNGHTGVNEVRMRNGRIVREGLRTSLTEMRLAGGHRNAREKWRKLVPGPAVFVVSRERAKLGYFWRHVIQTAKSGPCLGSVVNPDTGRPVLTSDDQLRRAGFRKVKHSEVVVPEAPHGGSSYFSALWQADNKKIQRMAPIEFISRFMHGWFDYGIADEVHELKGGDTAQGNALGAMASACKHTIILTGTLLGGYADELFFTLFRLDARKMLDEGFAATESGLRQFAETYGVLEKVTTIEESENACSKAKSSTMVKRRPGASPLLFGKYLMSMAAFVSLEDISDALPAYTEEVISVEMDPPLKKAYEDLETDIRDALREHHGNASVISTAMNALLLYPDRPFDLGTLYGFERNEETGERERFVIADPPDLDQECVYAKERKLVEEVKAALASGSPAVQVFAVYTRKRDVTRRLKELLIREGIHAEVLTAEVPPEQREAWYERHLRNGMRVAIAHPRLVMTGLDILACSTILWYETGYSIYVLRQASRRSWRIGQKRPVRVGYLTYAGTAQESCLRLMGKKLLVSLALEGKLQAEGLQAIDEDDDILTAMARELVTRQGVGENAAEVWRSLRQNSCTGRLESRADEPTSLPDVDPVIWTPSSFESDAAVQLSLF